MNRAGIKVLALAALLAAVIVSVRVFGLGDYLDEERLRVWIASFGIWGPVAYLVIYSIAPSLMVPGLPLTVAGGILFGPLWGSVYTIIGATIGASIAFLIARYLGRDWVKSRVEGSRLKELDRKVGEEGWKIVAFTRLIPLFPYNALNYAFGLTRVGFLDYLWATFVFMMPGVVAYVVFSSSILDLFRGVLSRQLVIGLALVIAVSLMPVIYKWLRGRKDKIAP
ncbi:MAG TPA: TVP38/TMEM64 family protein [Deltaproteobacteria bacterium]|nr:TVP38/TMEM64 family protein [Deltaproteobacteria bacterium]